uniref:U1-type domain-containing protein n=1 Tax=Peromyscus maniculatus bairdii TaxID=230844 RepID=A0A8C8ULQ8_PERMB
YNMAKYLNGDSEAELMPDEFEEKLEREKRHSNFTLCSVCNIQLNSVAQAQIHYNGKSHQKRLKQLTNGTLKNDSEYTQCQPLASPNMQTYTHPHTPPPHTYTLLKVEFVAQPSSTANGAF